MMSAGAWMQDDVWNDWSFPGDSLVKGDCRSVLLATKNTLKVHHAHSTV